MSTDELHIAYKEKFQLQLFMRAITQTSFNTCSFLQLLLRPHSAPTASCSCGRTKMNSNTKEPESYTSIKNTVSCLLELCLPKIHQVPYIEPRVMSLETTNTDVSCVKQLALQKIPTTLSWYRPEKKTGKLLLAKLTCLLTYKGRKSPHFKSLIMVD